MNGYLVVVLRDDQLGLVEELKMVAFVNLSMSVHLVSLGKVLVYNFRSNVLELVIHGDPTIS